MNSADREKWEKAMENEIMSINKNKTWELIDRVKGKQVIDVKWVYTRKSNDRYNRD